MTWDRILAVIVPALDALIEWGASALGESTDSVRARVLERLAGPTTDATDAEAAAIDNTWPAKGDE